ETTHHKLVLLLAKTDSLSVIEGFTDREMASVCAEIENLLSQIDDGTLFFKASAQLSGFYRTSGNMEKGSRFNEHLVELAQQLNNPNYLLDAYQTCGILQLQLGNFTLGKQYMEQTEA